MRLGPTASPLIALALLASAATVHAECARALVRPKPQASRSWWSWGQRDASPSWTIMKFYAVYDACQKEAERLEASRPAGYPRRVADVYCVLEAFAEQSGFRLHGPITIVNEPALVK
jgi:hypothetical protein